MYRPSAPPFLLRGAGGRFSFERSRDAHSSEDAIAVVLSWRHVEKMAPPEIGPAARDALASSGLANAYHPVVRCAIVFAVIVPALLGTRAANATPTSRLVYSRSSDADSCPDEQALRHAVAARVGYDPFFPYATRTIVVSIARRDRAFVASVDLVDEGGLSHGARELPAEGNCTELLDA